MDSLLVPYLTANNKRERQQQLDELLTLRAAPLIRNVLRRRLGFYVNAQGVNKNNQDAEDIYQEVMTRVLQGLNDLHLPTHTDIESFELYVSRVASNTCIDFLRAKSPAFTRLKYRLRDLLNRHKDLATWEYDGEVLCGFASWCDTRKGLFSDPSFQDIGAKLESFQSLHFGDEEISLVPLPRVILELFDWIGGPIEIDLLVRIIAHLLEITDQQIESLDDLSLERMDGYFSVNTRSGESHFQVSELLAQLWRAVIQLPAEQRDTFVFGFEDEAGQDFFTVLLTAEIVNWDEIAQGMGRSVPEIVRLRLRMPMDGVQLADELKTSRDSVYKWRFRAIRRLRAELKE
jgi:RNA polymerase sigma factor (sigma-70 family)